MPPPEPSRHPVTQLGRPAFGSLYNHSPLPTCWLTVSCLARNRRRRMGGRRGGPAVARFPTMDPFTDLHTYLYIERQTFHASWPTIPFPPRWFTSSSRVWSCTAAMCIPYCAGPVSRLPCWNLPAHGYLPGSMPLSCEAFAASLAMSYGAFAVGPYRREHSPGHVPAWFTAAHWATRS